MDIKEDNVGTNTILHYAERELAQMAHGTQSEGETVSIRDALPSMTHKETGKRII